MSFQPAFFIASFTNSAQSVTNASPNHAFVTKSAQSVTNGQMQSSAREMGAQSARSARRQCLRGNERLCD